MPPATDDPLLPKGFHTTRWSMVAKAGGADSPSSRDALEELCRAYWYPLYAFVRRRGHEPADARDLVQGYFARLLEKGDIEAADRERGRFRAFLLGTLKHYLANEYDRETAAKRGGGRAVLSLDVEDAEGRLGDLAGDGASPESAFDRNWALILMDRVMTRLREDYERAGRLDHFERLSRCLVGDSSVPYRELADELDMTETAFKVAVHRARKRYGDYLRREIAETLSDASEVDDELRNLFDALGS